MQVYYAPNGTPHVLDIKPTGWYTVEEWKALHPPYIPPKPIPPTKEELGRQESLDRINGQIAEVKRLMDELDLKSIRPLRAIVKGIGVEEEEEKLLQYETEIQEGRVRLDQLKQELNALISEKG